MWDVLLNIIVIQRKAKHLIYTLTCRQQAKMNIREGVGLFKMGYFKRLSIYYWRGWLAKKKGWGSKYKNIEGKFFL